jgi:ribose 5-phosphate isomerase B
MNIVIASDHAAVKEKADLIKWLEEKSKKVTDKGTFTEESCDYPDFAFTAAKDVSEGKAERGIIICGSGVGVSIVANKVKNVRAALCYNSEIAKLSRRHNNANVLCYGARFFTLDEAKEMIDIFLKTEFEGGRHGRRVDKIHSLTEK